MKKPKNIGGKFHQQDKRTFTSWGKPNGVKKAKLLKTMEFLLFPCVAGPYFLQGGQQSE